MPGAYSGKGLDRETIVCGDRQVAQQHSAAVKTHQGDLVLRHALQLGLDRAFVGGVERAGGYVKNQYRRSHSQLGQFVMKNAPPRQSVSKQAPCGRFFVSAPKPVSV